MIKKKILIEGKDFCGVKSAPQHKLYFIMKKGNVDIYSSESHQMVGTLSSETVTDICFNEDESRIYCINIRGGISMYDMEKVIQGDTEPMKRVSISYSESFELISNIHWIKDDIVLVPGDPDIYAVDVFADRAEKIYDYSDKDKGVAAYNSYYDEKKKILNMISDRSEDSSITLTGKDVDITIPAEVIHVDCKSVETIYAGDFRLILDNRGVSLFNKSVEFTLIGRGVEGSGEFTDKKFAKRIEQIGIMHIKSNDSGLTAFDSYEYLIMIDASSGVPDINYIETGSYGFEVLEGSQVLTCIENEGLAILTV